MGRGRESRHPQGKPQSKGKGSQKGNPERDRAVKLCVLERWMSAEFPSFGRWVSPERAETIARRAMPGTFQVVLRHVPASIWAQCDLDRNEIILPHEPVPIFVVLHELGHAWAPLARGHTKSFLESYQYRVWNFWENPKLSRAFEKCCRAVLA